MTAPQSLSVPKMPGKRKTAHTHLLPYPDFPLSPHVPTGRWYKVIRGRRHYFGKLADWQAALTEYQRVKDYLYTGRLPPTSEGSLALRDLANRFLTAKTNAMKAGELKRKTFCDYHRTCALILKLLGRDRLVSDLRPEDFSKYRAKLAEVRGSVALANEIQRVRTIFKWAYESELIPQPLRFGPDFKKPTRSVMRRERAQQQAKMFPAAEIKSTLKAASIPLRAMILLGINCGMGNTDVAELPERVLDLDKGIIDFPRRKTGIDRRSPLWPETVTALRKALKTRPKAEDPANRGLVFITRFGQPWVRTQDPGTRAVDSVGTGVDSVGLEFGKLLRRLGLKRVGVGFYALRHVFETIAGQTRDQAAIDRIMGHEADDMATRYREWQRDAVEDTRLRAVTGHVRKWLFGKAPSSGDGRSGPKKVLRRVPSQNASGKTR
jgi:integrase